MTPDTCVTEKEVPAVQVPTHELFHEGKSLGVTATGYDEAMTRAKEVLEQNPEWKCVSVRELNGRESLGSWWRRLEEPGKGRLIRTKELG